MKRIAMLAMALTMAMVMVLPVGANDTQQADTTTKDILLIAPAPTVMAPPILIAPAPTAAPMYEVVKGDCLWSIAREQLGSGSRWEEIYQLNQDVIAAPELIFPGQQLRLPA